MSESYSVSLVLIVPSTLKETANRLACAMGQDVLPGNTFSVLLASEGEETPTHFGCHAWSQEGFYQTLMAAKSGVLLKAPPVGGNWEDFDLTVQDLIDVLSSMIIERGDVLSGSDLFFDIIDREGLSIIASEMN